MTCFKLSILLLWLSSGRVLASAAATATLVNLEGGSTPFLEALKSEKIGCQMLSPSASSFSGEMVVWESKGRAISSETASALGEFVRRGGSLLIGFDLQPGLFPIQMNFLSPTTGWGTQIRSAGRADTAGEIATGETDSEFFGQAAFPSFVLPYHFMISPFHAVERGAARYDALQSDNPFTKTDHAAGDPFWTRPLLNREWKVRWRASDRAASPLLLTGKYGAGRVAVFAASLTTGDPALTKIWPPVVRWLAQTSRPADSESAEKAIEVSSNILPPDADHPNETGGLRVNLKNSSAQPLTLQVLARILTWERCPVTDMLKPITIAAGATTSVDIPMPADEATQYQALAWKRSFVVRLGILSESGATLLNEQSIPVDLSPATGIAISTDNLYQKKYPYDGAPGTQITGGLNMRMGAPVTAYAYPPGDQVHAVVEFTNGLHNLAALATAADETTPDNPTTRTLTTEVSIADRPPRDKTKAYGCWVGKVNAENVLAFHFSSPVTLGGISLDGNPPQVERYAAHNPGSVTIECDGKSVAQIQNLDEAFTNQSGLVHVMFTPTLVSDVRVILPWNEFSNGKKRLAPWLGHVELLGSTSALPPAMNAEATLLLHDSMTQSQTVVAKEMVSLAPGKRIEWAKSFTLPDQNGHYYRLEAQFNNQTAEVPILSIKPQRTLLSISDLKPSDAASLGFIVTRGFRNCFPLGTGTRETHGSWEEPDDLIWCYSRRAKQVGMQSKTMANFLYLSESDMTHYSNPWIDFPNGESIWRVATPNVLERMEKDAKWAQSKIATFFFSDRWDSGPSPGSQYEWQELVAFDEYLRSKSHPGLKGKTREELCREIDSQCSALWSYWQEQCFTKTVAQLRDSFAAQGKDLVWGGQGIPLASTAAAEQLSKTVRGMSDDNTWAMEEDSIPWTTARQSITLAYNPQWKVNMNLVWGWDSGLIYNRVWYALPASTEPTRRHYYDSTWRGLIGADGQYCSALTYGFGGNGGLGWEESTNDWQQMWRAQERFSLIYPDAPLGAGFIVSSSIVDSPTSGLFSGGGMGGAPLADKVIHRGTSVLGRLHDCGLSLPFTSNILALQKWNGTTPLVLLDLSQASEQEIKVLANLAKRGVKIATFAGEKPLAPAAAALFGVTRDGTRNGAMPVGQVDGTTMLGFGNLIYVPLVAESMTLPTAQSVADILRTSLSIPVTFPAGTMGYGFVSGKQKCIVIEDWKEEGRVAELRVHAESQTAQAVELNDHRPLKVRRDGEDWVIPFSIRPGDGDMIILQEGN